MTELGNKIAASPGAEERYKILRHKVRELQTEQIWAEFERAGMQPILIKGWAAARLYPQPFERDFVDVDLMIPPEKFDEAVRRAEAFESKMPVDLHKGARHLDALEFGQLLGSSKFVACGNSHVRVLCDEDHLRILCTHWLNDGGADREKLWDIYYGVARRNPETFDWDRLLKTVPPRRRRWVICAIGLAHKYLGLEVEDTPVADEARELPDWLTKAVEREWESGVKLLPLHFFLNDKRKLWEQIKKRVPPNPLQATIELDGDLDERPRIYYQIRNIFIRVAPSLIRIGKTMRK